MANLWSISIVLTVIILHSITVNGKPMLLSCDTYATASTCSGLSSSSNEGSSDCETCCSKLLERMYDCPPCRYFVLNQRRQGSSCFCTVCFRQNRHRRRHQRPQAAEQEFSPRFDF